MFRFELPALSVLLIASFAACASTPGVTTASPPRTSSTVVATEGPDANSAPTPFSASEIRGACLPGRTITFVIEEPGLAPVQRRIRFIAADDERATTLSETIGMDQKVVGTPETTVSTWEELRAHARFPKTATEISDSTANTPAGDFPCRKYVVTEGNKKTTLCFARELPGPPVEMMVESSGTLVRSMVLLKNEPGTVE